MPAAGTGFAGEGALVVACACAGMLPATVNNSANTGTAIHRLVLNLKPKFKRVSPEIARRWVRNWTRLPRIWLQSPRLLQIETAPHPTPSATLGAKTLH